MPDRRKHRGPHTRDPQLFAATEILRLRVAVAEFSWLLTRGYGPDASLKLIGDHHSLTARQRLAVMRASCSDHARTDRHRRRLHPADLHGRSLAVDGYNLLITLESALSGGLILLGRDRATRDLASVHGTYRRVEETRPALELVADFVEKTACTRVDWYLDRPVSNSGRLKSFMADHLARRRARPIPDSTMANSPDTPDLCPGPHRDPAKNEPFTPPWNIELLDSPDRALRGYDGVVVTTDSAVLDACGPWCDLAGAIITAIPSAWIVDLSPLSPSTLDP